MHLIKSVIFFTHGKADVKRGFSTNALLPPAKASFSLPSIVALRIIKDTLYTLGSIILRVPITRAALSYSKCSCLTKRKQRTTQENLDRKQLKFKRLIKLLMKRKLKLKNLISLIREENLQMSNTAVQQLLLEGNSKLTDALKKKKCTSSSGSSHALFCFVKAIDNTDRID